MSDLLGNTEWATRCARCGKSTAEDDEKTISNEPAHLHWNPIHEPGDDPTGMICPTCQGMKYDFEMP